MTVALAVVLARGGSKGLPRKNAAIVGGRPCLAWTITHAKAARRVRRIILSTNDEDMAAVGRHEGASIVIRPAELASDTATVDAAVRHAVGDAPGPFVILYGNVPVRPTGLIDRAVDLLLLTGCDSVQSYAPVGKHHPWWTARLDPADGRVRPWEGDVLNHGVYRRQDLPPACIPDGGVLALTRPALFLEIPGVPPGPHAFLGLDRRGVLTGEGEVVDIDTSTDLLVADAILRQRPGQDAPPPAPDP